ncbi:hypothetical protein A5699_05770 [Mycobacterium sp. E802]|nr:hypothetical protein A5699_05770 [Mycobacterium sp. E802]
MRRPPGHPSVGQEVVTIPNWVVSALPHHAVRSGGHGQGAVLIRVGLMYQACCVVQLDERLGAGDDDVEFVIRFEHVVMS